MPLPAIATSPLPQYFDAAAVCMGCTTGITELVGPAVPRREKESEQRAMLLLVLLKPWAEDVAHLLEMDDEEGAAL